MKTKKERSVYRIDIDLSFHLLTVSLGRMSETNSFLNKLNSLFSDDGIEMNPSLEREFHRILYEIQHGTFVDSEFNYKQLVIELISQNNKLPLKFLYFLLNEIMDSNTDDHIRERIMTKINDLTVDLTLICADMQVHYRSQTIDDSEEESDVEDFDDEYNDNEEDENDNCDDLENQILDELEFEHDCRMFSDTH